MSIPTPESLAIDCNLQCDMCSEPVNYGDDYVAHLQFAHQIVKNIPFFMDKALQAIKGEKRKMVDVVTLEEEKTDASEEEKEGGSVIDSATRQKIEKTVEQTMNDLFKDINLMVEGKSPYRFMKTLISISEEI